jgi:hypothetical protein
LTAGPSETDPLEAGWPLEDGVFAGKEAEERFVGSRKHEGDGSDEGQEEERFRKRWRDTPAV